MDVYTQNIESTGWVFAFLWVSKKMAVTDGAAIYHLTETILLNQLLTAMFQIQHPRNELHPAIWPQTAHYILR